LKNIKNFKVRKYDGIGNTFAIIDYKQEMDFYIEKDFENLAIQITNNSKIDTDGLIIVKNEPLKMIFYNRDGSKAPMCGNGVRAFSKYVIDTSIIPKNLKFFNIHTDAGIMEIEIIDTNPFLCKVNMGKPIFENDILGIRDKEPLQRKINIENEEIEINMVFMGTIHTVIFVDDIFKYENSPLGEFVCNYPIFSEKTNVNFVSVNSPNEISIRTFERGVGYTKACGTGCCAAVVIGQKLGFLSKEVVVFTNISKLFIKREHENVFMTGTCKFHYEVDFEIH